MLVPLENPVRIDIIAIVIILVKVEKGAKGKMDSGAVLVHTVLIVLFVHDILVDIRK